MKKLILFFFLFLYYANIHAQNAQHIFKIDYQKWLTRVALDPPLTHTIFEVIEASTKDFEDSKDSLGNLLKLHFDKIYLRENLQKHFASFFKESFDTIFFKSFEQIQTQQERLLWKKMEKLKIDWKIDVQSPIPKFQLTDEQVMGFLNIKAYLVLLEVKNILFHRLKGLKKENFTLNISFEKKQIELQNLKENLSDEELNYLLSEGKLQIWETWEVASISEFMTALAEKLKNQKIQFQWIDYPLGFIVAPKDSIKTNEILETSFWEHIPSQMTFASQFDAINHSKTKFLFLKGISANEAIVQQPILKQISVKENSNKYYDLEIEFMDAQLLEEITRKNAYKFLVMTIDKEVIFAAKVLSAISGGKISISSIKSPQALEFLANRLRYGCNIPIYLAEIQRIKSKE